MNEVLEWAVGHGEHASSTGLCRGHLWAYPPEINKNSFEKNESPSSTLYNFVSPHGGLVTLSHLYEMNEDDEEITDDSSTDSIVNISRKRIYDNDQDTDLSDSRPRKMRSLAHGL